MDFDLKNLLKALLLSTAEPLDAKAVQLVISRWHRARKAEQEERERAAAKAGTVDSAEEEDDEDDDDPEVPSLLTSAQIREGMDALKADFEARDSVMRLVEGPQGWRLAVDPDFSEWVRLLRNEPRPQRLSPAAMETLSIIAYRQPVTRAEMEAIRGVAIDSALNKLLEAELVHVTGRAELPGRPLQYGSTEKFLEYCGIRSLDELPASDVVSRQELDQWIREAGAEAEAGAGAGFRPGDEDMGLPANEQLRQQELLES